MSTVIITEVIPYRTITSSIFFTSLPKCADFLNLFPDFGDPCQYLGTLSVTNNF